MFALRWFKKKRLFEVVIFHKLEELINVANGSELGLKGIVSGEVGVAGFCLVGRHDSEDVVSSKVLFETTGGIRHAEIHQVCQVDAWKRARDPKFMKG